MSERAPTVSVTMPVFDNAAHVVAAVRSILDQTFADLELIVVDDGSRDATAALVAAIDDPRIVLVRQPNQGGAHATNRALAAARGRYVALFAGDDVSRPQRLARELEYLASTGARAVFSWVDFIDDAGDEMRGPHFAAHLFNHPQRSRGEMLRHFFFEGNYLCGPSALIEADLLRAHGPLPVTSAQVPDFALWCRLLRDTDLHVLPERLVAYRVRAASGNVSSPSNNVRAHFELVQLHREAFAELPEELFRAAFHADLRRPDFSGPVEQRIELASLWLRHRIPHLRQLGHELLYRLLQDPAALAVAEARYGFGLSELLRLTATLDVDRAVEHLDLRDAAIRLEDQLRATEAEYRKLEAYTRWAFGVKDEAYLALREAHDTLDAEHRRLHERLAATESELAAVRARLTDLAGG